MPLVTHVKTCLFLDSDAVVIDVESAFRVS